MDGVAKLEDLRIGTMYVRIQVASDCWKLLLAGWAGKEYIDTEFLGPIDEIIDQAWSLCRAKTGK